MGWHRVLFLDDDITGVDPADVDRASSLLSTFNAVGFHVSGFPDNSVVCHAYRDAGGLQKSFIGGGALAVQLQRCNSFFPGIYNDDWFFLLDDDESLQPTAVTGEVVQYPYDPFHSPDRARTEEFGDVLAEGVYWLLDQDQTVADAGPEFWARYLIIRRRFIEDILVMVQGSNISESEKSRRSAALKGSLGRLAQITAELCSDYLQAWIADRKAWSHHVDSLPIALHLGPAVEALSRQGAPKLSWCVAGGGARTGGLAGPL